MTSNSKPPFRILVTGSRDWDDLERIWSALNKLNAKLGPRTGILIHGDARGADKQAAQYWDYLNVTKPVLGPRITEAHPIHDWHWEKYGKAAGFKRNQRMVDLGANLCLAFIKGNSGGASHCARRALIAGIKVIRFED